MALIDQIFLRFRELKEEYKDNKEFLSQINILNELINDFINSDEGKSIQNYNKRIMDLVEADISKLEELGALELVNLTSLHSPAENIIAQEIANENSWRKELVKSIKEKRALIIKGEQ